MKRKSEVAVSGNVEFLSRQVLSVNLGAFPRVPKPLPPIILNVFQNTGNYGDVLDGGIKSIAANLLTCIEFTI
jgi:hypothetical protein